MFLGVFIESGAELSTVVPEKARRYSNPSENSLSKTRNRSAFQFYNNSNSSRDLLSLQVPVSDSF